MSTGNEPSSACGCGGEEANYQQIVENKYTLKCVAKQSPTTYLAEDAFRPRLVKISQNDADIFFLCCFVVVENVNELTISFSFFIWAS